LKQVLESGFVVGQALRLPNRLGIPLHAQCVKLTHNDAIGVGYDPRGIDIFYAQQPLPVSGACIQVAGHCRY
jgi:hypothetical protein